MIIKSIVCNGIAMNDSSFTNFLIEVPKFQMDSIVTGIIITKNNPIKINIESFEFINQFKKFINQFIFSNNTICLEEEVKLKDNPTSTNPSTTIAAAAGEIVTKSSQNVVILPTPITFNISEIRLVMMKPTTELFLYDFCMQESSGSIRQVCVKESATCGDITISTIIFSNESIGIGHVNTCKSFFSHTKCVHTIQNKTNFSFSILVVEFISHKALIVLHYSKF